jgi:hypothetical protein
MILRQARGKGIVSQRGTPVPLRSSFLEVQWIVIEFQESCSNVWRDCSAIEFVAAYFEEGGGLGLVALAPI